ncbi:MAG: hypothetical protein ACT4QE_25625 [Anaerolineales bacterium]
METRAWRRYARSYITEKKNTESSSELVRFLDKAQAEFEIGQLNPVIVEVNEELVSEKLDEHHDSKGCGLLKRAMRHATKNRPYLKAGFPSFFSALSACSAVN